MLHELIGVERERITDLLGQLTESSAVMAQQKDHIEMLRNSLNSQLAAGGGAGGGGGGGGLGVLDEEPGGWGEGEEEEVVYDGRQDGAGPAAGALSQDPDAEPGRPGGGRKAGEVAKAMTRCELGGGLVPLGLVGGGLVPLAWLGAGYVWGRAGAAGLGGGWVWLSGWGRAGAAGLGGGWVWLGAGWCRWLG